jgi:hypothetical protein
MHPQPRRYRPRLEGLEARELLSAVRVVGPAPGKQPDLNLIRMVETHRSARAGGGLTTPGQQVPTPRWVNENLLPGLAQSLYAPITTTTPVQVGSQVFPAGTYTVPQPTTAEVRRETFWLEFVGHYTVGPPRFSNQAATIHIYSDGKSVTSNQFRNGRAQILLFPPADPTAAPTTLDPLAGRVSGLVSVFTTNILQSGSSLFAEAANLPGVASNDPAALDHGLPSRLAFRIDPVGVSGGAYSTPSFTTTPATVSDPATRQELPPLGGSGGAVAFNQGAGVLDIQYLPDHRLHAGASQSGKVIVRLQGLNNLTGVLNPLYKGIN